MSAGPSRRGRRGGGRAKKHETVRGEAQCVLTKPTRRTDVAPLGVLVEGPENVRGVLYLYSERYGLEGDQACLLLPHGPSGDDHPLQKAFSLTGKMLYATAFAADRNALLQRLHDTDKFQIARAGSGCSPFMLTLLDLNGELPLLSVTQANNTLGIAFVKLDEMAGGHATSAPVHHWLVRPRMTNRPKSTSELNGVPGERIQLYRELQPWFFKKLQAEFEKHFV